jgi:hypothetical protein
MTDTNTPQMLPRVEGWSLLKADPSGDAIGYLLTRTLVTKGQVRVLIVKVLKESKRIAFNFRAWDLLTEEERQNLTTAMQLANKDILA